jgi:isocitrate lyase
MSNNERATFQAEVARVLEWWKVRFLFFSPSLINASLMSSCTQNPRFARITRPYTAAQVVAKRGTIPINYPSDLQAKKLWASLSEHFIRGTPSHTYGA